MIAEAGVPAGSLLYVGDRLDNNVRPAQNSGIATAVIRRGPWGYILSDPAIDQQCLFHLDSLAELPALVRRHNDSATSL
ncbi:hypothetical protein DMP23_20545 [Amycolatopsis sp. A1MSW2902]